MCGRIACTLDKDCIQRATSRHSKNEKSLNWVEKYNWQVYQPSYNLSPSQISPVLVADYLISAEDNSNDNHVITPMRWGFIPSWYKGSFEEFSLKTNNCRIEGILEKPTYRGSAVAGRRCVILANGFYEWKVVSNKQKQPYFIYFPQEDGPDVFYRDNDSSSESKEWKGPHLLTMAGLFDIWRTSEMETIYSYSVITMDASKTVSYVHSRMPAILESDDEVAMWLDSSRVPTKKALTLLKPVENLQMHPVSTVVNNSRNNSVECIKPWKSTEKKLEPYKHTSLTSWLKKETSSDSSAKRLKTDS